MTPVWFGLGALALVAACDDADSPAGSAEAPATGGGSATACPGAQVLCGDQCADVQSNAAHCGGCGKLCPVGQRCVAGTCEAFCAVGQELCDGECTTLASSPNHCGECGVRCGSGAFCSAGKCGTVCAFELCEGEVGLECADTKSNPDHCGGCGAACPDGQSCADGYCRVVCPAGHESCDGVCVDTRSDADHCGSCGNGCAEGFCFEGGCGCASGLSLCGDACVDTKLDAQHCGRCDAPCPTGATCALGKCTCPAGTTLCGDSCVDTKSDAAHCGACGEPCATGSLCDGGACRSTAAGCSAGLTQCGSACVNLRTAAKNCGKCGTTCPAAQSCVEGKCQCPAGTSACDGGCVDLQVSGTNCGACGEPCAGGTKCVGGVCVCGSGTTLCGAACVNTTTSTQHCGKCDQPCGEGQTCQAGKCQCPSGKVSCNEACVDLRQNDSHCGECNTACSGGKSCVSGTCQCGTGATDCGGTCVDVQSSAAHCGACGAACPNGQACTAGKCAGASGSGEDGCGALAGGVSLREIAIYQSFKIPLMQAGTAVALDQRIAPVVQDRLAMFRAFVDLDAGPRELSARLSLTTGGTTKTYFSRKTLAESSVEDKSATTFQIRVPREAITADTKWAMEVVECASGTGAQKRPRFPAAGAAELLATPTGKLQIKLIPLNTGGLLPDTSEATRAVYESLLEALYPITDVELSVGSTLDVSSNLNWSSMLDAVRARRAADAAPAAVYYYGLVKHRATFQEFCGGSCTTGIGYVTPSNAPSQRAALGIGFGDDRSAFTLAHELGHNHGRNHAPCVNAGSISGVDSRYPYSKGVIGVWGWDSRKELFFYPEKNTDLMGYCSNQWISDYNYRAIASRVVTVSGASNSRHEEPGRRWRVLLLEGKTARWGIPMDRPTPAEGTPVELRVLDHSGAALATTTGYRTEIGDLDGAMVMVPEPTAGWAAITVAGYPTLDFD